MLLTVLLALFGVHEGLRLSLINQMDKSLLDNAKEIGLAIEASYPDLDGPYQEMDRMVLGHDEEGLFVQLLGPDGEPLWKSNNTPHVRSDSFADPDSTSRRCTRVPGYRVVATSEQGGRAPLHGASGHRSNRSMKTSAKLTTLTTYAGVLVILFDDRWGVIG